MLVIGSGPGGQRAAIQAAKLGKRVAIVEQQQILGGVTAHTGTIPSKTLREAVLYLCGWREKGFYGRSYRVKADITADDLMQRLHTTIRQQIEIIRHQLTRNGVAVITGTASFLDPHTLRVVEQGSQEQLLKARHIVIATGTVPHRPDDIPFDDATIIDSDGILGIKAIPRTMTVIGAGVIGVEYATIFSALDTKITLIDGRDTILDFVDADIVDNFRHDLQDRGIAMRLGEDVARVEKRPDGRVETHMKSGRRVVSDLVMVAAGRMGATGSLALGNAGLEPDNRGRLTVDEHLRTRCARLREHPRAAQRLVVRMRREQQHPLTRPERRGDRQGRHRARLAARHAGNRLVDPRGQPQQDQQRRGQGPAGQGAGRRAARAGHHRGV